MTAWIHDEKGISTVEAASRVMFGGSLEGITDDVLAQLAGTIPTVDIARSELEAGISSRAAWPSPRGAARRLVTQGGAYINHVKISDAEHKVTLEHLATPTMLVVRSGKKAYRLVRVR